MPRRGTAPSGAEVQLIDGGDRTVGARFCPGCETTTVLPFIQGLCRPCYHSADGRPGRPVEPWPSLNDKYFGSDNGGHQGFER